MIYLRQSLQIAAYEAARVGISPGADVEAVQAQCDLILLGRGITEYTTRFSPPNPSTLSYGDLFTVEVDTPAEQNAIIGGWFYRGRTFTGSVTAMAEY